MKIVLMDESNKRRIELKDALEKKHCQVHSCCRSSDFMESIMAEAPDTILLDVSTWYHGKPIYTYFAFSRKIEGIPIIFYNAPEKFTGIAERQDESRDHILRRPVENEAITELCS